MNSTNAFVSLLIEWNGGLDPDLEQGTVDGRLLETVLHSNAIYLVQVKHNYIETNGKIAKPDKWCTSSTGRYLEKVM